MSEQLDHRDFDIIIESLEYSKMNIENSGGYPSYEIKRQRLETVELAVRKIRVLKRGLSAGQKP
jgi:hypothetical protein